MAIRLAPPRAVPPRTGSFLLGADKVKVVFKPIKNVHLSVHPPAGRISVAAPDYMQLDTVRLFALARLDWIRQQQQKLAQQQREPEREYVERESHTVWGKRYLLKVIEAEAAPQVELTPRLLRLQVRPGSDRTQRQSVLDAWYRQQVRDTAALLLQQWQARLDVTVARCFVQHMKTRWGSCNPVARTIRLNTELAKKPRQCLEYLIVHELMHLLEPTHNARFVALMDKFMPDWHRHRELINQLPLRHEAWKY